MVVPGTATSLGRSCINSPLLLPAQSQHLSPPAQCHQRSPRTGHHQPCPECDFIGCLLPALCSPPGWPEVCTRLSRWQPELLAHRTLLPACSETSQGGESYPAALQGQRGQALTVPESPRSSLLHRLGAAREMPWLWGQPIHPWVGRGFTWPGMEAVKLSHSFASWHKTVIGVFPASSHVPSTGSSDIAAGQGAVRGTRAWGSAAAPGEEPAEHETWPEGRGEA